MPILGAQPGPPGRSAVEDSLLGIKTSAAFLSSLGNNLRLDSSSPSPRLAPSLPSTAVPPLLPSPLPNVHSHAKRSPLANLLLPQVLSPLLPPPPSLPPSVVSSSEPQTSPRTSSYQSHRRRDSPTKSQSQQERLAFLLEANDDNGRPRPPALLTQDPATVHAACDLISASVAAQSYVALRALLLSPLGMVLELLALTGSHHVVRQAFKAPTPGPILGALAFTWFALLAVALLAFILLVVRPFRAAAAQVSPDWAGTDDVIVVLGAPTSSSSSDNEKPTPAIIGALLLEYRTREAQTTKSRRRRISGRGLVRAWAVSSNSRNAGVGAALLAEAVRVTAARGGDGAYFAEQHAHAARVLPRWCGGAVFERRDRAAQTRLGALASRVWGASAAPSAAAGSGSAGMAGGGCAGGHVAAAVGGKRSRASSMRV